MMQCDLTFLGTVRLFANGLLLVVLFITAGNAQNLKNPGTLVFRPLDKPELFLEGMVNTAKYPSLVIAFQRSTGYLLNAKEVAGWVRNGQLTFNSNHFSVRKSAIETGVKNVNGTEYMYVVLRREVKTAALPDVIEVPVVLQDPDGRWSTDPSKLVELNAKTASVLEMIIKSEPVPVAETARISVKISGAVRSQIQLTRLDGKDVVASDRIVNPIFMFTAPDSNITIEHVFPGMYDISASTRFGQKDVLTAVPVTVDGTNRIVLKLPPPDPALTTPQPVFEEKNKKTRWIIAAAVIIGTSAAVRSMLQGDAGTGNDSGSPTPPSGN